MRSVVTSLRPVLGAIALSLLLLGVQGGLASPPHLAHASEPLDTAPDSISTTSITLEQWQTSPAGWTASPLDATNSSYREGDTVPFRAHLSGFTAGQYTFPVCRDFFNTAYGYLYLTAYNATEASVSGQEGGPITSTQGPFAASGATIEGYTEANPGTCSAGRVETQVTLTITDTTNAYLLWGGHLAAPGDTYNSDAHAHRDAHRDAHSHRHGYRDG